METHVWHPNTKTDITEYCNWHEAKLCNRGRKMKSENKSDLAKAEIKETKKLFEMYISLKRPHYIITFFLSFI